MTSEAPKPIVLLTGATGYVGSRLLKVLLGAGHRVRCMVRSPESSMDAAQPDLEIVRGDILRPESLPKALEGVTTAYYLIHSMASGGQFEQLDRIGSSNFAEAAQTAGVRRIIYLGGLGEERGPLSSHLRSRQEVGKILRSGRVKALEFRSSVIIGRGSFSFEMIRALVDRLPIMVTPKWVATPCQPIFIGDLLEYLRMAIDIEVEDHCIFEIGGAERTSYGGLMREYARQRGLRRLMIPVPALTPKLSSLWLGLVTPYHARVGRKLIEGLQNPTVVKNPKPAEKFGIRPLDLASSIARALAEDHHIQPVGPT